MIPKIIHYCWLSNDPYPEEIQKCMNSWKQILHDYEFILWNFDRFDINSSIWVKQAFEAKKYAFAADFIRLYAVYHYGGIYLDMDVEVIKPFDNLLQNNIMLAYENDESKYIEAGCFGAEKEHPLIRAWLDYYSDRNFTPKVIADGDTLPKVMKTMYYQHTEYSHLNIYSSDYFTAKNFQTGKIKTTDNTYCIHHYAGSWLSDSQKRYIEMIKKLGNDHFSKLFKLLLYFFMRLENMGLTMTIKWYYNYLKKR